MYFADAGKSDESPAAMWDAVSAFPETDRFDAVELITTLNGSPRRDGVHNDVFELEPKWLRWAIIITMMIMES